jgi:hypothetical protein
VHLYVALELFACNQVARCDRILSVRSSDNLGDKAFIGSFDNLGLNISVIV